MVTKKAVIGAKGEHMALQHLISKGYEAIQTNYRYKHAEIDIIVKKADCLIFVEVKTRTRSDYGHPEEAVDQKKAAKIKEGAEHYIFENNWHGNIRFDIVAIKMGEQEEIVHFEDAFY